MAYRERGLAGMTISGEDPGSLAGETLVGTRFVDCDLRATTLAGAVIDQTRFVRCLFSDSGLRRVSPRIIGPYAVIEPNLEWSPEMRGACGAGWIETCFWHGDQGRERSLELSWPLDDARCTATVMHMSVLFGFQELGFRGQGSGGAVRFADLLRDGPPPELRMPAPLWSELRSTVAARLPRWMPPAE